EQAQDRERRGRLAAARLPDEPEALARLEREVHALDGVQLAAVLEVEPDVEVLDLQERGTHSASFPRPTRGRSRKVRADRCATRSRGLSASSNAPPTRLHARMSSATSTPGGTIAHHAPVEIAARSNAFWMIRPSEIALGSLRPRNASAVSSKIATAMVRTVLAISRGAT